MAEAPVKYLSINNVTTNIGICTNVLSFVEDYVIEITPQFIPNTFQGADVKQDHKWWVLTIVVDSETNIFDTPHHRIVAANNPFTTLTVDFTLADGAATVERWTYEASRSYVMNRNEGKIDMDTDRNTIEYQILVYGTRGVTHP